MLMEYKNSYVDSAVVMVQLRILHFRDQYLIFSALVVHGQKLLIPMAPVVFVCSQTIQIAECKQTSLC